MRTEAEIERALCLLTGAAEAAVRKGRSDQTLMGAAGALRWALGLESPAVENLLWWLEEIAAAEAERLTRLMDELGAVDPLAN